jgi:HEAT repeat protein
MTFRWLTRLALSLTVFAVLAVVAIPSLRYKAVGVVRGEPFYRGLPHRYWIDSLRDSDAQTRKNFFQRIHKNDAVVVPILAELLQDESADLRRGAAEGAGRVGPAAAATVRLLCSAALRDPDQRVRVESNRALDRIGEAALPQLMEALDDNSVRAVATAKLGQLGPAARPAVPPLLRQLQERDRSIRELARAALDRIGLDRETTAPALGRILEDDTSELRFWAAETLVGLDVAYAGRAIPVLFQGFQANSAFHDRAVQALTKLGTPAVPALLRAVQDPGAHLRAGAVETLGGIHAPEIAPALFGALKDADDAVRHRAAYALERSGTAIIPAERVALRDPEDHVRLTTLELLAKLGRAAQSESGAVQSALKDPNAGVRKAAAVALEQISPDDVPPLVEALVQALREAQAGPRIEAAKSLALFETRAKAALPALVAALEDADPQVRSAAADTLGAIGASAPEVVTALSHGLKDMNVFVRRSVAAAVRKDVSFLKPGPSVRPVVAVLGEGLKDTDADVRRIAAEGLQEVVYQACDSDALRLLMPALAEALPDKEGNVRALVEDALATACAKVAVEDKALIPVLIRILLQKTGIRAEARAALAKVLSEIGPADQTLLPDLLVLLKDETTSPEEQTLLLWALAKLGPGAKAAIPALTQAAQSQNKEVRTAAMAALQRIQAKPK